MAMSKIKICGLQTMPAIRVAFNLKVDFIGFVFVANSQRYIEPHLVKKLIEEKQKSSGEFSPQIVGLFSDNSLNEVIDTINNSKINMVQLCGMESPEFCLKLNIPVIKVIHVRENDTTETVRQKLQPYELIGVTICLDTYSKDQTGGTGQLFNWKIAEELSKLGHKFLVAGGLNSDNVQFAIKKINPWGVDVSTGIETNHRKDTKKIKDFVKKTREILVKDL